ncbi:MAG TPA: signal recognition particle protein [Steroidobacteraceae bacterium]|nr:signal recognition particle protein [Steroidobacteraceae bacterium]
MFDRLTERLSGAVAALTGRGRLTEDNIADALRQVRLALIEADVAVPVVKSFIDAVKARALGAEVQQSLTPGQVFIKILHDELVRVMGEPGQALNLRAQPPVVVLLAGLQGAGKTTTAAKLARLLETQQKKRVLLASVDVYRPAAITQLERLAAQVGVAFHPVAAGEQPLAIAAAALEQARRGLYDVLIVDTAGRLHVDEEMMQEVRALDAELKPHQRLFIVDSMAGQDAVNQARAFNAALDLTGVILTKADGDARGGAALSVRHVTGKPILYVGVGEKVEALEPFHPERVASRILGMGDVLSLVEQVQRDVDRAQAEKLAKKLAKGKGFDFDDLRDQMQQLEKMGGIGALMEKLPGKLSQAAAQAPGQFEGKQVRRQIAMINSMTPAERRRPELIDGSRKRRIANGAGVQVQDVNRLLKQFLQMQKVMKQFSKGGVRGLMRSLGGRLPPGFGP